VQCALTLEFFRAVAIFFVFFPEASAIQSSVGRYRLLSKCSFFVCQFKVSSVVIGFPVTSLYPLLCSAYTSKKVDIRLIVADYSNIIKFS
jgi:hypothetical protein